MVAATFWVEGKGDQKFLADLITFWFGLSFDLKEFVCRDEVRRIEIRIQELGGKTVFATDKLLTAFNTNATAGVQNFVIIDADNLVIQRQMLEDFKRRLGDDFHYFLLPDDKSDGELENLLEQIIHPQNQVILNCWAGYEACVEQHDNPTRPGYKYTIPAKKSKIYSYLEVLLGETDSEKELAKDPKRDFTNTDHWQLDGTREPLSPLKEFLATHLNLAQ